MKGITIDCMEVDAPISPSIESERMNRKERAVEVRVPASTSNLGPGFDCFGLALKLYLTVRATSLNERAEQQRCRVRNSGAERSKGLPQNSDNLIYQAMSYAAEQEGLILPPVRLVVHNDIPLGRGLGSSAAAIVAGIKLSGLVCGRDISDENVLRYGTRFEGHADNVAASLYGGWAVTCLREDGSVIAVKRAWPEDVKVIVISPKPPLATAEARAALPQKIDHTDAVYNIQRVALFGAALEERRYDLIWEAMQDRLHHPHRQSLMPGLAEALATPQQPGLLGLALSGAGPSILALANSRFDEIGDVIADCFRRRDIETSVRLLAVDNVGTLTKQRS